MKPDNQAQRVPAIPAAFRITLHPGREKPILAGSPWVFSGAIAYVQGEASAGDPADLHSSRGDWLGRGLWDPASGLPFRLITTDPSAVLDASFLRARLRAAIVMRHRLFGTPRTWRATTAYRLIFSEADGLSGLIADQYGHTVTLHVASAAWLPWLPELIAELRAASEAKTVVLKADPDAVKYDGLPENLGGDPPPAAIAIRENDCLFEAAPAGGQKTGFYLDQRDNRRRVAAYAPGRRILSAYCYTGAFEVNAARAGAASITGWDTSAAAIQQALRHHDLNGTTVPVHYETADVPRRLRAARDARENWDMIILDPPRLVASRNGLEKGLRAYKDINLLAMKLLTPGGILATFSCSGLVDSAAFRRVIGWAAADSGRNVRIIETLSQPADHPVAARTPESDYLKGFICWVD